MRRSSRWGNRSAEWAEYNTPEIEVPYYSSSAGNVTFAIEYADAIVYRDDIAARSGLNYLTYDLSVAADRLTTYLNSLEAEEEDGPEESDDGKTYLVQGKYKIVFESGGQRSECELEIK